MWVAWGTVLGQGVGGSANRCFTLLGGVGGCRLLPALPRELQHHPEVAFPFPAFLGSTPAAFVAAHCLLSEGEGGHHRVMSGVGLLFLPGPVGG